MSEEKGSVAVLRNATSNEFFKSVLVSIIDSYACCYREKANELEIKGSMAFKEEMVDLVKPFVTQIATKCETILSKKSSLEEDQELLVEFAAFCLASEKLLAQTPYVKHVLDLILKNLPTERKKEACHRMIWFLDDVYEDNTWEALQFSEEGFHRIYFHDEKQ